MIESNNVFLSLIDMQERLFPHMYQKEELQENCIKLIKGLKVLGVPIVVNEQYKKGLGETIEPLKEALGEYNEYEKTSFSCCATETTKSHIDTLGKKYALVAGIESHICVLQSALDFVKNGYETYVIANCVSSRNPKDLEFALRRLENEGAKLATTESILFEMIGGARHESFKEISKIIK